MKDHHEPLRYPIGKYESPAQIGVETIDAWITDIELFPKRLSELVHDLKPSELLSTYRPEGWTIAQLVHHCCDSHMNSYIRFRLALTEDNPTIRPYHEDRWAQLPDAESTVVEDSLQLLVLLHSKWVKMIRNITPIEMKRTLEHPEFDELIPIDAYIGNYAWHCNHHLAHVMIVIENLSKKR